MKKKILYSIFILSGTIIGAGFFSLPFIASKVGLGIMLAYFLVLGATLMAVNLIFAEISVNTPDFLRLPGFAKIHLGSWGKRISSFSVILGMIGTILAYLIIGGQFLTSLMSPILGGGTVFYTLIYFIAGATFIFLGIHTISKAEALVGIGLFVILLVILFQGLPYLHLENLTSLPKLGDPKINLFLPYGAILFSLWGTTLIPEVEEVLRKKKEMLKKVIPIATLIPVIIYILFIVLVVGICGFQTTENAISGLKNFLGNKAMVPIFLLGILTTFTSFITLGLTLKKIFWYDLGIKRRESWGIACFLPLILFLIGFREFISVISFVGGVMLGIDALIILLMYQKIKPQKKFLILPLVLILLGGVIFEIIHFMG